MEVFLDVVDALEVSLRLVLREPDDVTVGQS